MLVSEYEDWEKVIEKISHKVARDFPDVEKEDLSQHLWQFVLEVKQRKTLEPHEDGAFSLLYIIARRYAWSMRKEHLTLSPQYSYRTSDVRRILETQFDHIDWDITYVPEDAQSLRGDDSIEISAEIAWGLKRLRRRNERYYDAIIRRYRDGIIPDNNSNERKRMNKGIEMLAEILNWYYHPEDVIGARPIINNATARYLIKESWDWST